MYGLCHHGVEQFVIERYGEKNYKRIKDHADLEGDIELDAYYEDAITARMFASTHAIMGGDFADILRMFGRYWIDFTSRTDSGHMVTEASSFTALVRSLNDIHDRLRAIYPKMVAPYFELHNMGDGIYHLHYHSQREGFGPMIVGLLERLAEVYGEPVQVEHITIQSDGGHDIFEVTLLNEATPALV